MRKTTLLPLLLVVTLLAASRVHAQATPAPIRLKAASFNPQAGQAPPIPAELMIGEPAAGQGGYYIVQFRGPIQEAWKSEAAALGAEFLDYLPEYAFKVRMTAAQAAQLRRLASVGWMGVFHPGYKLSPKLARKGTRLYTVGIERGADSKAAAAAVAAIAGVHLVQQDGRVLVVAADSARLNAIAHVLDVAWIENFLLRKKHNEYGGGAILRSNTANTRGYDGSTQTIAVADTGLGGGTASTAHADIPSSRIAGILNWAGAGSAGCYNVVDDGARDVDSGHGTHTAASAVSDGGTSGEGRGTAPAARLVFQAVENWTDFYSLCEWFYLDGYYLIGLPPDLNNLYHQAWLAGARIHSNSWGSDALGDYTLDSANTDSFLWNRPEMTITFSAGNSGIDADGNGVVDADSMGSPATAKNVISVGASENDRAGEYSCDTSLSYTNCNALGGNNSIFTYGAAFGFPANPVRDDPSAGNAGQMAAFSSRGPTDDNRIKPDVVAPGTWVLSGYSDLYQQGYDGAVNPQNGLYQYDGWGHPASQFYKYMGGTSMSNPLVAGAAAVVRDYYQKAHSHAASGALVKARLINSAVDLLDENNDGVDDNDFPIPNIHEGWGRVDLDRATTDHQFVDNAAGLSTGGNATYSYDIGTAGQPLRFTLVWTDYPSTEAASLNLVNNLDLVVTSPSGAVYRGNVFSGGWSQTGGTADSRNNVENVYVQAAEAGAWTARVNATNVAVGPQKFALVADGAFGSAPPPPPNQPPTASFTHSCTDLSCNFDASGSSDGDGSVVSYGWNFGDGGTASGVTASHTYAAGGSYNVTLTVTDDDSATDTETQSVTVTAPPPPPNQPPTASFNYSCTDLACTFNGGASSDSDGSIVSYAWTFGDGNSGSGANVNHSYAAGGTYSVTLTVTDDDGATDSDTQSVTVSEPPPPPPGIDLSATAYKVKGKKFVDLTWSGATGANVDVYRNGEKIATTGNDGAHTDVIDAKKTSTYTYQVCEAGTSTCSNQAGVTI